MGIIDAIRYVRGYIEFSLEGGRPERFVNLCAMSGVPLWNGSRRGNIYSARTSAAGGRQLAELAAKAGCSLSFRKEKGLRYLAVRHRRRLGFAVGALLLCSVAVICGAFIWTVEINGLETIERSEMETALAEYGVKRGVPRGSINVRDTERKLLLRFDEISWVAVNISGSRVTVEISERVLPPAVVDDDTPYNVVASMSGYIVSMEVYNGQPVLAAGDSVAAGEVIVSGIMESAVDGGSRYVHARARVLAQTPESIQVSVPYIRQELEPVETVERKALALFGIELPLTLRGRPGELYIMEESRDSLPVLTGLLGAELVTRSYTVCRLASVTMTAEEAAEEAAAELAEQEELLFEGGTVVERVLNGQEGENTFTLYAEYIILREIGKEVEIFIDK